jgi:hypothetical protein
MEEISSRVDFRFETDTIEMLTPRIFFRVAIGIRVLQLSVRLRLRKGKINEIPRLTFQIW